MLLRPLFATAILASAAVAGTLLPTMALAVNEKSNEKKIDPVANGFVGFSFRSNLSGVSLLDLKNLDDGNKVRIRLSPDFANRIGFFVGPITVAEKRLEKDVVTRSVTLQQVPPGRYEVTHFYADKNSSGALITPDTLVVERGKISSLGAIAIQAEVVPLVNLLKSASVRTESPLPDTAFASFTVAGLNHLPILHDSIHWTKR